MSYRSIVVHLDASERATYRLESALSIAKRFNAHLAAIYATFTPEPSPWGVMAGSAGWYEKLESDRQERGQALERLFHAGLARAGLSGEWIDELTGPREQVARRGRCADLVIAGQDDPNDPQTYIADHFAETLVMTAGRPLLLLPYSGVFPNVGENILVAWNASREATRAVHDALPFLRDARHVTLVSIDAMKREQAGARIPGADIASTLARHGVHVTVRETDAAVETSGASVGDALISEAQSVGANLIVMGAYGHARWQEVVLGGATRTLLRSMTMPVLMSR
jgi:nucleotide-binding universal stress UspA family protein